MIIKLFLILFSHILNKYLNLILFYFKILLFSIFQKSLKYSIHDSQALNLGFMLSIYDHSKASTSICISSTQDFHFYHKTSSNFDGQTLDVRCKPVLKETFFLLSSRQFIAYKTTYSSQKQRVVFYKLEMGEFYSKKIINVV